jgi:hypothetical protein
MNQTWGRKAKPKEIILCLWYIEYYGKAYSMGNTQGLALSTKGVPQVSNVHTPFPIVVIVHSKARFVTTGDIDLKVCTAERLARLRKK